MPVIFVLNLKEALLLLLVGKSTILPLLSKAGSSLWCYHKLPDDFEKLSSYPIKLSFALSIYVLFISLMQSESGAQFLIVISFSFS